MAAIHFERDDQVTVNNVASNFIKFYYDNLNNKSYDQILNLIKNYSIYSFEKNKFNGNQMSELFMRYQQLGMQFSINDFDSLHSGARRINIVVTGVVQFLQDGQLVQKNFTEYIHLATGKPGEFWIQMGMFKFI